MADHSTIDHTGITGVGGSLGAWTTYTPTWAATGTAPAIGDGSLVGRYKLLDSKTLAVSIVMTAGSTTTFGTGQYSFTLPAGQTAAARIQLISGGFLDDGTAFYAGVGWIAASDTKVTYVIVADATEASTRRLGHLYPVTMATGDTVIVSGIIEVV